MKNYFQDNPIWILLNRSLIHSWTMPRNNYNRCTKLIVQQDSECLMHNGIIPESLRESSRKTHWYTNLPKLIFSRQISIRFSDARQSSNSQRKYCPLEKNGDQSARRYCIVQYEFQRLYPEISLRRNSSTLKTQIRFAILDRSWTRNERRDREMCDLISRCRGTMVPASASARRNTPASRSSALSEGTKDAEGGGGCPPDVPSEIAYAAIGGEVATLPTVLGHRRDRRRRHLEHHLEEGNHRWGSFTARLRPVRDVCPPCSRWSSGEAVRVGNTYRGTISRKISRWFTIWGEP